MAKGDFIEQVDKGVDAIMKNVDEAPAPLDPRIQALLVIASELRDLPDRDFKARLKAEILSKAHRPG